MTSRRLAAAISLSAGLLACERDDAPRPVTAPREAVGQLLRCALDDAGGGVDTGRVEASLRRALRSDRARFAVRAGSCETALETPGGAHPCAARLRARWAEMLRVTQRPGVDAIDQDVAVRRVGEALAEAVRRCP